MPRRNRIEVVINAKDNASKVFEGVAGNIQGIGSAALNLGVNAIAGATVAMVGLGVVAVNTFSDFEKGMNEVFTLLPDISQAAMDDLENQLLSFDNAVGRTSEETIPALYQALSAGVDQNTVFEFLELANKAAVGGATDLETAVDGITSVVNAYGEELIDATLASDLMFTAVRLGKTNFEELSASLFNVVPNAAALGVSFGDVTAAIATITAQGVPTSVATTQMRQAFVELGDAGSSVSEIFMRISGQSFKDFIAGGGSVADAMGLLETEATILGIGINEMFGSVEAGNAALALTGASMDTFISNTEEMNNAAGATEGAFETMNQGISLAMNRLMATWESTLIRIGSVIAPLLTPIIDIFTGFVAQIAPIIETVGLAINVFQAQVEAGMPIWDAFRGLLSNLGVPTEFITGLESIVTTITNIVKPIIDWVTENIELEDVLIAIGIAVASVVIPALIGMAIALAPILLTIGLLVAGVSAFRNAWETDWLGIRTVLTDVWENTLLPAFERFGEFLSGGEIDGSGLVTVFETISFWIINTGIPAIANFVAWFLDNLPAAWENAKLIWDNVLKPAFDGIASVIFDTILPALSELFNWFMEDGLPAIQDFIENSFMPVWNTLVDLISEIWVIVQPFLTALWEGAVGIFQLIMDFIENDASNVWNGFIDLLGGIWGAVEIGIMALHDGIKFVVDGIIGFVQGAIDIFNDLIGVAGEAQNIGSGLGDQTSQIFGGGHSVGDIAGAFGNAIFGGRQFGGAVTAGQPVMVGESGRELFIPQQNGSIANNQDTNLGLQGNSQPINITFVFNRGISDEEARDSASILKRELQAQGVNVTGV